MATSVVSRSRAVPKLPNIDELTDKLRESMPGLAVYNPSHLWLNPEIHGRTNIWIPPDKGGAVEENPATGIPTVCDGMGEIKGRFVKTKDSSGKVIQGQDAESAIKYLCAHENYGQMGVVWIPKLDPELDAEYKKQARAIHVLYQRTLDEGLVQKRREFKANWEKTHKDQPCPPPTDAENGAIERLQEIRQEKTYLYECEEKGCPGYATNDWGKFEVHMQRSHKITPDRVEYDSGGLAAERIAEPVQTRRGPGRPRKVVSVPAE